MRHNLAPYHGQRIRCVGIFNGFKRLYGRKRRGRKRAIINDVYNEYGEFLTNHIWAGDLRRFKAIGLSNRYSHIGTIVSFTAEVYVYKTVSSVQAHKADYGLRDFQDIEILPKKLYKLMKG